MADGPGTPDAPWHEILMGGDRMAPPDPVHGPRWFTDTRLNFAEHLLRRRDGGLALVSWNEQGPQQRLTYADLATRVARVRRRSPRGLVWETAWRVDAQSAGPSSPCSRPHRSARCGRGCSPDFGTKGCARSFRTDRATVLIAADGYRYAGKTIDCLPRLAEIVGGHSSLRAVWVVPYLSAAPTLSQWHGPNGSITCSRRRATSPCRPSCVCRSIIRCTSCIRRARPVCPNAWCGARRTLLQHWKSAALHTDLSADDVLFYFTTCGWMMWNWLVSGLALGVTVVLYDGAPLAPDPAILWRMAEAEHVSVFGTSAKYLAVLERKASHLARWSICRHCAPSCPPAVRSRRTATILCTATSRRRSGCAASAGAPTSSVVLHWATPPARCIGANCRCAGSAWPWLCGTTTGRPWSRKRESWCVRGRFPACRWPSGTIPTAHSIERPTSSISPGCGGMATGPRSRRTMVSSFMDAATPRSIPVGCASARRRSTARWSRSPRCWSRSWWSSASKARTIRLARLFVRLRDGGELTEALRDIIRRRIREHTSPHHVPRVVIAVPDIPRTISGKITELAVRETIHGRPVKNQDALANPEALAHFRDRPELVVGPDR